MDAQYYDRTVRYKVQSTSSSGWSEISGSSRRSIAHRVCMCSSQSEAHKVEGRQKIKRVFLWDVGNTMKVCMHRVGGKFTSLLHPKDRELVLMIPFSSVTFNARACDSCYYCAAHLEFGPTRCQFAFIARKKERTRRATDTQGLV